MEHVWSGLWSLDCMLSCGGMTRLRVRVYLRKRNDAHVLHARVGTRKGRILSCGFGKDSLSLWLDGG